MGYSRVNTTQVAAISSAVNTAATVKLPNASTTLPADQSGTIFPIGANSRWRIKDIIASFSATPATPAALTITDGTFTWTIDVTGPLILQNLDLQCAGGAEVDITLAGAAGAIGHLNISVVSEG